MEAPQSSVACLSRPIDPRLDLEDEIDRLKRERDAIILAHYYQDSEIQDLADVVGDSLALAQAAARQPKKVIVFAGVHFMAETAKILNPSSIVVVPDLNAGCSLSDRCPPDDFARFLERHPGHVVVSYVNCSARVKAMSDLICTSSNAEKILRSIPEEQPVLFAPDQWLARYLIRKTGRQMVYWPGSCIVHETFNAEKIVRLKHVHPAAEVIAHPECEDAVLALADFIGSTAALLRHTQESPAAEFIVATEPGIIHQMRKARPDKTYLEAPNNEGCACNKCPHMRLNTLEKLYLCLRDLSNRIEMDEDLRVRALRPLERMLALS
ncbi:MAG: quinolinate synthase NadA [Candidatus Riflebacteria bacterium]|nr:quinolinate synthase NadA [Candidatus Riflebacteria bacterium]